MSLSGEEHKAFLDKHYPFIEQGMEPPGRYAPTPQMHGVMTWSGQSGWRTRHGPVVVWWNLGKAFKAESVHYRDGTRGIAQHTLDYGWRRQATDGRRWIHGEIEIRPDDVVFTDGTQPVYTPPQATDGPNLEAELACDAEFLNALQGDRFANAVYVVFRNRTFYKGVDERSWSCGDRQAARLVRDLRGLGESYQDWFPHGELSGTYPDDRPEREAMLRRSIEQSSQPYDFKQMVSQFVPEEHRAQVLRQLEGMRSEFEKRLPKMEEERLTPFLESSRRALSRLDENADVFATLHAHITRLGWRTENAQDRARADQRRIYRALAVLQDIKALEQRPEGMPAGWTERLRRRALPNDTDLPERFRSVARRAMDYPPSITLSFRGPVAIMESLSSPRSQMSEDERDVRSGRLRVRLTRLAVSGRISKEEYDALSTRLMEVGY
jgi:hypothetical protein